MKKRFLSVILGLLLVSSGVCFADQVYYVQNQTYQPTLLDKIEDSTQDFAETVGDATVSAADKTGKAIKKGAKATGHAFAKGAKEAGHATKKGAKKATNWSARKIRSGAEKVIIKTEDTIAPTPQADVNAQ
ncbi:hypothetical protein J6I39_05675 [bacterium]|nr:hypothetical protein [bacterium]